MLWPLCQHVSAKSTGATPHMEAPRDALLVFAIFVPMGRLVMLLQSGGKAVLQSYLVAAARRQPNDRDSRTRLRNISARPELRLAPRSRSRFMADAVKVLEGDATTDEPLRGGATGGSMSGAANALFSTCSAVGGFGAEVDAQREAQRLAGLECSSLGETGLDTAGGVAATVWTVSVGMCAAGAGAITRSLLNITDSEGCDKMSCRTSMDSCRTAIDPKGVVGRVCRTKSAGRQPFATTAREASFALRRRTFISSSSEEHASSSSSTDAF